MRATLLLLLACVTSATGCDGVLGIGQHTLAEAGPHGDGGEGTDGEAGVMVNPVFDGGTDGPGGAAGEQ